MVASRVPADLRPHPAQNFDHAQHPRGWKQTWKRGGGGAGTMGAGMPVDTVYRGCSPVLSCGTGCEAALWVVGCDLSADTDPSQRMSTEGRIFPGKLCRLRLIRAWLWFTVDMDCNIWVCYEQV
jgi:hypothetical protein